MEKRLSLLALTTVSTIILGAILFLKPYYGLMDDHSILFSMLPELESRGLFRAVWNFALSDIHWGMFRVTYPIMAYLIYRPATLIAPWFLFFWNAACVMALVFLWSKVWQRILGVPFWRTLLGCAIFFYGYDLFQHPSLQEKAVLFWGALLLLLVDKRESLVARDWLLVLLISVLGVFSKASFFIYLSTAIFLLWIRIWRRSQSIRAILIGSWPLTLAAVIGLVFTAVVSRSGGYTSHFYSLAKILPNLFSRDGLLVLLPASLWAGVVVWRKSWRSHPEHLLPLVAIAAFFTIFLPWGVAAYIQTIVLPVVGVLIALIGQSLFSDHRKAFWLVPLACLGIVVAGYRSYTMFGRLSDIGQIVADRERLVEEIWMPCGEGVDAMRRYLNVSASGREIGVHQLDTAQLANKSWLNGRTFLFDGALCPLPGRAMSITGCDSEHLFAGRFTKSFQVVRLSCR